jgi:hypothetical protein
MSITMYIFTAISDANYADSRFDSSSTDIAGRGNKGRGDKAARRLVDFTSVR